MKDYYYILGVKHECSADDIRDAYRKLSKKFHPDLNPGDSFFEERFREIREAWETLGSPDKRSLYDREYRRFIAGLHLFQADFGPHHTRHYHTRRIKIRKSRIGIGFTLMLILTAVILGVYAAQYIFQHTRKMALEAQPTAAANHLQQKRKKTIFYQYRAVKPAKQQPDTAHTEVVSDTYPADTIAAKPAADTAVAQSAASLPYATFIKANATGVVNMLQNPVFSSGIIGVIPSHAQVEVLARGDTYYKVSYHHTRGYVPEWALLER